MAILLNLVKSCKYLLLVILNVARSQESCSQGASVFGTEGLKCQHLETSQSYLLTLVELFCHRVEWIHNRTSLLDPVVDIYHRDSHLFVPSRYIVFPSISWPSPRSSSSWLYHECFALGSHWCHPFDAPPNFFVSDLVHSGLSCSLSETPHLCCCQHLPFFAGEGPVFTLVK